MNNDILVFVETYEGVINNVSFELISKACMLLEEYDIKAAVHAVVIGYNVSLESQELFKYGADKVIVIDDISLNHPLASPYAFIVSELIKEINPNICFVGATHFGRELAPRIATKVKAGLTADATLLELEKNDDQVLLLATRPAFGGNIFGTIICPDHRPQMATVRPSVFESKLIEKKGIIDFRKFDLDNNLFDIKIDKIIKKTTNDIDISKADFVIGAGRGMKKHLDLIERVCKKMNAQSGYSRAIIDEHLAPKEKQVGQTGKTIRPKVYIACGISGAVQHVVGMENSDYIIAINTDKNAAIFNVANLGIVADAKDVLESLLILMDEKK